VTDKEFITRYDNGEKFTEEELSELLYDFYTVDEDRDPDIYKCHQSVTTIFKVDDRLFALCWIEDHGMYQEHEFYDQPYEVKAVKKMVEITEYERVK
jgi:hypothetical protein